MNVIATVLLWTALVAGLLPMTWFLIQFRPSRPIRSPAYLISGLMLAILIGYARIATILAIRGWVPRMDSWMDATASIVPLLVIDAMVIGLLVSFLRYRTVWRTAMDSFSKGDPR